MSHVNRQDDDDAPFYTDNSKQTVERALAGRKIMDRDYTFRDLEEIMKKCAGDQQK